MLYCPGSGQELLSALGVTLVCHASNVFLVLKVLGIKQLCWFLQYNTTNNLYREFYTQHCSLIIWKVGISDLGTVVVEW